MEMNSETQPEELWQAIKETFHNVAESVLGRRCRLKMKQWITPETLELVDKKRLAHQRKDTETLKRLKKECRRKRRKDKNDWLARECEKIDELDWLQNSKAFFDQIKRVKKKSCSPEQVCIRDEHGNLVSNSTEVHVLSRWKRYGESLFSKPAGERPLTRVDYEESEPPLLLAEVEDAISRLKNNKVSGVDGIPAELIKHSGRLGAMMLHKLVSRIWETCVWPDDWRTQEFIPLFKSGDKKQCSNYRTIALISHSSKILLLIVLQRILLKLEDQSSETQTAYRRGKGCRGLLVSLQVLIEKLDARGQSARLLFVDYSKAFDTPSYVQLFENHGEHGVSQAYYCNSSRTVLRTHSSNKMEQRVNACVQDK